MWKDNELDKYIMDFFQLSYTRFLLLELSIYLLCTLGTY